jgi:hypothetical protein
MTRGRSQFEFDAEVWLWDGPAAWHFVSLPEDLSDLVRDTWHRPGPGFGSLRVEVVIGAQTWRTSIFPDSDRGTYVLPVKKEIRRRLGLAEGSAVTVGLTLL